MRPAGLLIALLVVLGCSSQSTPSRSGAKAEPTLRVVDQAPLKVRGEHFRPDERVRVATNRTSITTSANGNGFFVVTLSGATRCNSSRVLARGSAGSYVVVKLLPSPECMPARSG